MVYCEYECAYHILCVYVRGYCTMLSDGNCEQMYSSTLTEKWLIPLLYDNRGGIRTQINTLYTPTSKHRPVSLFMLCLTYWGTPSSFSPPLPSFRCWSELPNSSTNHPDLLLSPLPPLGGTSALCFSSASPVLSVWGCSHGPLGAGAVPQLHDCLNHCAADVAACENLSGLKHGAKRLLLSPGSSEVEGDNVCSSHGFFLPDTAFSSSHSVSFWCIATVVEWYYSPGILQQLQQ